MAPQPRVRPAPPPVRAVPQRRPPAPKAPRNVADEAHAARAAAEVAAAVAAVDAWYESAAPEIDLDLTNSCVAAVEAAEARAAEMGVIAGRAPGKGVIVRLRHPPSHLIAPVVSVGDVG